MNVQEMQCMEVWGGSQLTAQTVAFGGLEAWVFSKPYGGATEGGDVYYASSCATGRITRLLLADVAGHGASVAETATDLRDLMRRFVNRLDQGEFVRLMNQEFVQLSKAGSYATAVVATYFQPSGTLSVCNAGHPRPLVYRAETGEWELLGADTPEPGAMPHNLPLGLLDISDYFHTAVQMAPGDRLMTYSDALIEAGDGGEEMLGEEGVLAMVRSLPLGGPEEMIPALLARVEEQYPGSLAADDVTVMMVTATGRRGGYTLGERFGALGRLLGTVWGSWREGAAPVPLPDANVANLVGYVIPAVARRWRGETDQTF